MSDPAELNDFEECQQYISRVISSFSNQAKMECHVVSMETDGGTKGGNGNSLVDKIKNDGT